MWLLGMLLFCLAALALSPASAGAAMSKSDCDAQLKQVNHRSSVLAVYQQSENDKYAATRAKWAERIIYASQWVPEDAEKAQKALYKYDALRASSNHELNQQIKKYAPLKKQPLDCSDAKRAVVEKSTREIKGSGNALIAQKKSAESQFAKKEFKKATDKLVKKLHDKKRDQPKPKHSKLQVKSL